MARNDHRRFKSHPADHAPVDRAPWRAGAHAPANSWHALAHVTVASTLVVALVVGGLALLESLFAPAGSRLARHVPAPPERWNAHAHSREPFLPIPTQPEPALLVTD